MNDICLLMRTGKQLDARLRRALFSMAQYMIEAELEYISFDGVSEPYTATMRTDFKTGCQDLVEGLIFSAHIEYEGAGETETIFLADYRSDWRDGSDQKWEPIPVVCIECPLNENWRN
jgi:hypothetical protein